MSDADYETIRVRFEDSVCFLRIDRPEAKNTINGRLVAECSDVLSRCEESVTVIVWSGTPEVFCFGADFDALVKGEEDAAPGDLYDLWLRMATGPYVTVAQVRGQANAGGVGFVAASDIALADETAQFGLSELLFGLYPACVLPFLIRRIGVQRAHYLTVTTQPILAKEAREWGLVDAYDTSSDVLLSRHLHRLRRLSKTAIRRYKAYRDQISGPLERLKAAAVAGNREVFGDPHIVQSVARYVERGLFPWENA